MQGIKDDRFCANWTFNLTVGCLMYLKTGMKKGKPFFETTQTTENTTTKKQKCGNSMSSTNLNVSVIKVGSTDLKDSFGLHQDL